MRGIGRGRHRPANLRVQNGEFCLICMNFIFTLVAFCDAQKLIEDSMKKHEAFQFLVKRSSANSEREVSRKEHYDQVLDNTSSKECSETV